MVGDSTVLIDCGGINSPDNAGELAGRYLLSRGRKSVDTLVLTHLHQDHSNGVAMLIEMVPLRQLIVPAMAEELPVDIQDSARRHGVAGTMRAVWPSIWRWVIIRPWSPGTVP